MRVLPVCLFSLCLATSAFAQLGNCANAYWADSLRCQAFPLQSPQANFGSVPAGPAQVKTFTRVFLNFDPAVRCADGTRPVMYVDPAVGGASNNWVFSFTGGGAASTEDLNADGIPDDAQDLVGLYADPAERGEMGTAFEPPMKELDGINDPDPLVNPTFSAYNRVRIEKCGYDYHMGRASYEAVGGFFAGTWPPSGAAINFNIYQQGYLIVEEVLQALSTGFSYNTWSVDLAGNIVQSAEALPPLIDADKVLFVGHSGGAHGLYHNIDNLAATFAAYAPNADVRALFDANFLPANENEPWFDMNTPLLNDAYSGVWAGQSAATDNTFTYDGALFWPGGPYGKQYDMFAAALDASCVAAHPAPNDWPCTDRFHVLLNHIATPYFYREDFTDPNQEHTNGGAGHTVRWGNVGFWAHCPSQLVPCLPRLTVAEYRERLTEQFQTILDDSPFDSELATGADPSLGAGNYPTMFAWMPQCGVHEGSYNDDAFFNTTMDYIGFVYSMDMFVRDFMSVGRTNLRGWYVDGWADGAGNLQTTLTCN